MFGSDAHFSRAAITDGAAEMRDLAPSICGRSIASALGSVPGRGAPILARPACRAASVRSPQAPMFLSISFSDLIPRHSGTLFTACNALQAAISWFQPVPVHLRSIDIFC
ncbi:hypothetical protein RRG08_038043 [Elysia crispata]|uniref:Uncharacterized protein n=1 Tax=Elysia crispata TaxID=231223 RepID=A0AAE1DQ98_9GAST|nr:hypothetical protein RRG08_038043 [Elysia crispata]